MKFVVNNLLKYYYKAQVLSGSQRCPVTKIIKGKAIDVFYENFQNNKYIPHQQHISLP
jgi:hypothetical protein